MSKQMDNFMQYKSRIAGTIGQEKTTELISKSVFIVSAGTNDFVVNYFTVPIRKKMYTIPQYQHFLVQNVHQFIKVSLNSAPLSHWRSHMGARVVN